MTYSQARLSPKARNVIIPNTAALYAALEIIWRKRLAPLTCPDSPAASEVCQVIPLSYIITLFSHKSRRMWASCDSICWVDGDTKAHMSPSSWANAPIQKKGKSRGSHCTLLHIIHDGIQKSFGFYSVQNSNHTHIHTHTRVPKIAVFLMATWGWLQNWAKFVKIPNFTTLKRTFKAWYKNILAFMDNTDSPGV